MTTGSRLQNDIIVSLSDEQEERTEQHTKKCGQEDCRPATIPAFHLLALSSELKRSEVAVIDGLVGEVMVHRTQEVFAGLSPL